MEKVASEKAAALKAKEAEFAKEKEALEGDFSKIDAEFDGKRKVWEEIAKRSSRTSLRCTRGYQREGMSHPLSPLKTEHVQDVT